MSKPLNESLGQEVVTKWACQRAYRGDFLLKSESFRVTDKMFVVLRPEEMSSDAQMVFGYSTRFHQADQRLSDSAEQAITKLEKIEQSKIKTLRDQIAQSQVIINEISRFRAQWRLINSEQPS